MNGAGELDASGMHIRSLQSTLLGLVFQDPLPGFPWANLDTASSRKATLLENTSPYLTRDGSSTAARSTRQARVWWMVIWLSAACQGALVARKLVPKIAPGAPRIYQVTEVPEMDPPPPAPLVRTPLHFLFNTFLSTLERNIIFFSWATRKEWWQKISWFGGNP